MPRPEVTYEVEFWDDLPDSEDQPHEQSGLTLRCGDARLTFSFPHPWVDDVPENVLRVRAYRYGGEPEKALQEAQAVLTAAKRILKDLREEN